MRNMPKDVRYREKWVFYYDSDCGFCKSTVRWLSKVDCFDRIHWSPYQALQEPPRGLSWDDLNSSAYLDTGQGRLHEGFYAFRMLALKLLPLIPLVPLFWFPGVNLVGVKVYGWVAKNRYRMSGCPIPGITPSQDAKPPSNGR